MGYRLNPRNILGTAADGSVLYATRPAKPKATITGELVHYNDFWIGFLTPLPDRGCWMIEQPSEMGGAGEVVCGKKEAVARLVELYWQWANE
ncbi:hypothetical protein [Hymenobacter sp. YC55]|uniref:hypothetical protein n=1 Tax=Hymenobacter sp. YC55 TaxID=3034019 RepID=UPI0023F967A0|nr:hypothetical protein [Hymenobacter sp. YC55]